MSKCRTAQVIHLRRSDIVNGMAVVFGPPAKINFFLVGAVLLIKTFQLPIDLTFYKHTGTGGPEYFTGIVVLSNIFFQALKNTSPTERITELVYESTARTGIFKVIFAH